MALEDIQPILQNFTRYFHGTGTPWEGGGFDPSKLNPDSLYGPGVYLTSDPRPAGGIVDPTGTVMREGYSQARQRLAPPIISPDDWFHAMQNAAVVHGIPNPSQRFAALRDMVVGQEARDLDLYERLRDTLMTDQYGLEWEKARQIANLMHESSSEGLPHGAAVRPVLVPNDIKLLDADMYPTPRPIQEAIDATLGHGFAPDPAASGEDIYRRLTASYGKPEANAILSESGIEGIKYAGGRRIPMADLSGNAITHDALAVFPQFINRLRNGITGSIGGGLAGAISAAPLLMAAAAPSQENIAGAAESLVPSLGAGALGGIFPAMMRQAQTDPALYWLRMALDPKGRGIGGTPS